MALCNTLDEVVVVVKILLPARREGRPIFAWLLARRANCRVVTSTRREERRGSSGGRAGLDTGA
jgi:hypothetical protein